MNCISANYIDWISHEVGCPSGYTGSDCSEDLDECTSGLHECFSGSACSNKIGSYECLIIPSCPSGFELINFICTGLGQNKLLF